jgi:hypothetical protein
MARQLGASAPIIHFITDTIMSSNSTGRYEWRSGARFSGDSDAIGRALDQIRQVRPLDGEAVVEAAADPDSPMHHLIEWDDAEAARLHRIGTGRKIIRSLQFVTVERGQEIKRVAFVCIPSEDGAQRGDYRHPWEPLTVAESERAWRLLSGQLAGVAAALRDLEAAVSAPGSGWAERSPKVAELRRRVDAATEAAEALNQG